MSDEVKNKVEDVNLDYNRVYTYADYLKFGAEEVYEIIRGKILQMTPAPSSSHQEIASNLHGLLWGQMKEGSCKLFSAPFDVILPMRDEKKNTATTVVQPDLCIICDLDKIEERGCFGPPSLVIEIVSPFSSKRDVQDKYSIYEEAGVKEYWIVLPKDQLVEVFFLKDKYERHGHFSATDKVSSAIFPDLEIDLSEVFTSLGH